MTGYQWRDPRRVGRARLAELAACGKREPQRGGLAPEAAASYQAARTAGLRVWEAAIAAGVSQSTGRRLERQQREMEAG